MVSAAPRFLIVVLTATLGCDGVPRPPNWPTFDRVAVSEHSIGIPYGSVVVFRTAGQLVALRVVDASRWGYKIEYEWQATAPGTEVFGGTTRETATTEENTENNRCGSIRAGPLFLQWSRGSEEMGWLYWPDKEGEISVCAVTWSSVDSIDLQNPEVFWYTREMFD
jgi:hypothetical protein